MPDVHEFEAQADDQVIVLASDGIWEALSNEQVAWIANFHYGSGAAEVAANDIIANAAKSWKKNQRYMDDLTVVVIWLDKGLILKSKGHD